MKVLFVSHVGLGLRKGGVQSQISSTSKALQSKGIEVVYNNPWSNSLIGIDVCHLFTAEGSLYPFAITAKKRGIPLVLSPIVNSSSSATIAHLKTRYLSRIPGMYVDLRLRKRMLQLADAICPLTQEEGEFLTFTCGCDSARMHVVHNGVERRFADASADLYMERFGQVPDVLFVGRIDSNKNVIRLVEALRNTGLRLTIVGFPSENEPEYFEQFRKSVHEGVRYLGLLEHSGPLLESAYAAAKVFALPSFKEVMPLTVLEAILARCRIVVTENTAMSRMLTGEAFFVNPGSISDIRKKVLSTIEAPPPSRLRRYVLENCSWEKVGSELAEVYSQVTQKPSKG